MAADEAGFSAMLDWAGSRLKTSRGQRTQTMSLSSLSPMSRLFQARNTTSILMSKGLLNAPGENNCFLNSAVQVLWHLDVFRRSFREMAGHACMGKACIFCALKVLFTQLQYGEEKALPPDALRKALASAFKDEQRFQLGCMDDAAECFENILVRIHFHLAHELNEDMCNAKHCVSHQKFAMTLIEHCVCPCGATSEPFPFTQMVHYVSCTALCGEAKRQREKHPLLSSVFFGQLLRSAGAIGDIRQCPSDCGRKIHIRRVLMNCPDVVGIGLVWDSDRPSVDHIMDVISCLGTTLRLPDLFNSVVDEQAKKMALNLVGVVTYYGKHYSTFFYNTRKRLWIYFDDASVKQVGPNWKDVVERCRRGHFQPLLLLFANPNGQAVNTANVPKVTTILPGYQHPDKDSPDKPRASLPFSSSHRRMHGTSSHPHTGNHSGGALESTGAIYKSLASVPEFQASSRYAQQDSNQSKMNQYSNLNSVVEVGHDALGSHGGQSATEPLSVDGVITHGNSFLLRQNQQRALAMAGFACTQENEAKRKPAGNLTQEAAGFIESATMPQPLLSGDYEAKHSNQSNVNTRALDSSNLLGHDDVDNWVCADGNMSLPRQKKGVLLPQTSQVSATGVRYPQGYRKPQNGGRSTPQAHANNRTDMFELGQRRPLTRHESCSGRMATSKSIPIYENVVNGLVTNGTTDTAEGNVTSQSRHSLCSSAPDPQRGLTKSVTQQTCWRHESDRQITLNDRRNSDGQAVDKCDSILGVQNQLSSVKLDDSKNLSLTNNCVDTSMCLSTPAFQRSPSNLAAVMPMAKQGLLADAIRNNEEHQKTLERVASYSSSSSLASSAGRGVDSKRSSQASQASTFTTDSADTSRSSDSRSGSLRSKYGHASGFLTLPRKKQISDFAEAKIEQQPDIHVAPMVQQRSSAPAQFAGVFVEENNSVQNTVDTRPTGTSLTRRPSHLQHFTSPAETSKSDLLEVGSVGSKDSGYRSRDRSSASSGSVYSADSPVADTALQIGEEGSIVEPTSRDMAKKKDVESLCMAVCSEVQKLMDRCYQLENEGDLALALAMCTSTVTKLKSTLRLSGITDTTRHYLQTKYNTSVVKSRSLHRKLQIFHNENKLDSIDASINNRPHSPMQRIRPASTQPMSSHGSVAIDRPASTQPISKYYIQNTAVASNGLATHSTDPRTGLYRPHSAQLPRKQYGFNQASQGLQRPPANGYRDNSGEERYVRSSEPGQRADTTWSQGATGRNLPKRSAVGVNTTVLCKEAPMSDPSSLNPHGIDSTELPRTDSPSQKTSSSPPITSPIHIVHSKPANIHTRPNFTGNPLAPISPSYHFDRMKMSSNICENVGTNVDATERTKNASLQENIDHLCATAFRNFERNAVKYSTLPRKWVPNTSSSKQARYVIEVHGNLNSTTEESKEKTVTKTNKYQDLNAEGALK